MKVTISPPHSAELKTLKVNDKKDNLPNDNPPPAIIYTPPIRQTMNDTSNNTHPVHQTTNDTAEWCDCSDCEGECI